MLDAGTGVRLDLSRLTCSGQVGCLGFVSAGVSRAETSKLPSNQSQLFAIESILCSKTILVARFVCVYFFEENIHEH
jgi:hypothetical protein